jgi:hypothetical protein
MIKSYHSLTASGETVEFLGDSANRWDLPSYSPDIGPFDRKMADPVRPLTPDTLVQLKAFVSFRSDVGENLTIFRDAATE